MAERFAGFRARAGPPGQHPAAPARLRNPARTGTLHIPAHHKDHPQQALGDLAKVNVAAGDRAEALGGAEMPAGGVQEIPEHRTAAHRPAPAQQAVNRLGATDGIGARGPVTRVGRRLAGLGETGRQQAAQAGGSGRDCARRSPRPAAGIPAGRSWL